MEKKLEKIENAFEERNVRSLIKIWNKSFAHGVTGDLERAHIEASSPNLCKKLTKYEYKFLFVDNCSFLELIDVWRKRKLAKAIMKGKAKKLKLLLEDRHFSSSYLSLKNFAKNSDEFVLYLYGYLLAIHNEKKGSIDLVATSKEFIHRVYLIQDPIREIQIIVGFFDRLSYYVGDEELIKLTEDSIKDEYFRKEFKSNY